MKTPMQEFKKWFDENKRSLLNHEISKKITELIESEKKVIVDAYIQGADDYTDLKLNDSDKLYGQVYYNETFKP